MYRLAANTREEYIKEAEKTNRNLKKIDDFIQKTVPSFKPWFYNVGPDKPGMTFKMLAYGKFAYTPNKAAQDTVDWPIIGIALQKNYISIYIAVTRDHKPLVDFFTDTLDSTKSGKNNFSFKTFEQLNKDALGRMLKEAATIFKKDAQNPVRFKEGTYS